MALEGTHIRIAIDLMDKFNIQDISSYISGTVYPDSRYITKTIRNLTHDDKYMEKNFATDDFKKGWQIHLLYDGFQGALIGKITGTQNKVIKQSDETWIEHTAVKVLQEISDLEKFNVAKYSEYIKPTLNPNNEDPQKLEEYYQLVREFLSKGNIVPDDYKSIFSAFGINDEIAQKVIAKCLEFKNNPVKMNEIECIYEKSIAEFYKFEQKNGTILDIEKIAKENKLEIIEAEFFCQKKHVARVKDIQGNKFILKTGAIEAFQVQLLKTAKLIEAQLYFKVPAIIKQGEGWILIEEIEGRFLNDFYEKKPDWCIEVSKKVADSYQLVINEIQKSQSTGNLLNEGKEWLFSRLEIWSKPIINAGLIESAYIENLKKEFEDVVNKRGAEFFGWFHGNIIGDHIIVSGDDIYLIDLAAVPRAGRNYHDFLRALDFMFLKTAYEEQMFESIQKWIKQYLSEFDEVEVKLVFALRNIGILGWDILHHKIEYMMGDIEKKKQIALKFIKREY